MAITTYPPAFDPDKLIAEDRKLREIDVFLEGDSSNPMFFYVNGLDGVFTYGEHYFTISFITNLTKDMQQYDLRPDTEILFEVHDANGIRIISDIYEADYENGTATGYFNIEEDPGYTYKPIVDGQATLTVVAELEGVPSKWENVYNYRCTFPFQIIKNYINANSPKIISPTHKLYTLNGKFSFVIANISVLGGADYDSEGDMATTFVFLPE